MSCAQPLPDLVRCSKEGMPEEENPCRLLIRKSKQIQLLTQVGRMRQKLMMWTCSLYPRCNILEPAGSSFTDIGRMYNQVGCQLAAHDSDRLWIQTQQGCRSWIRNPVAYFLGYINSKLCIILSSLALTKLLPQNASS